MKTMRRICIVCVWIFVCIIFLLSPMKEASGASYYVSDLSWVSGSAATATWSSCDGANYYEVQVYVYRDSRQTNLIGSTETGTADTRVDVQQEIYKVISGSSYDQVYVNFEVKPVYLNVYSGWEGSFSYRSDLLIYRIDPAVRVLPIPQNVKLSEDYVASFDTVEHASWLHYKLQYEKEDGEILETGDIYAYGGDERFEEDITPRIYSDYKKWGLTNETIKVRVSAMAFSYDQDNPFYISSDYSDWTEPVTFNGSSYTVTKLPIPQNVKLSEDYVVSFDTVEHASWLHYKLQYEKEDGEIQETGDIYAYGGDEHFEEDITPRIYSDYKKWGLTNETIKVRVSAMAFSYDQDNPFYISSDYSDWTEPVTFNGSSYTVTKLPIPQNVKLSEDYVVSFDTVEHASWLHYKLQYEKEDGEIQETGDIYAYGGDEHFEEDITPRIYSDYKKWGLTNETIKVRVSAMAFSYDLNNPFYTSSDYSDWTEPVLYGGEIPVRTITLSPEKPIVYIGNSYYLGKTIKPASAHYESIKWVSSVPNVLRVDSYGKITGASEGKADITASIGDVSDTVEATVYDIESNITNAKDEQTVTDKAGDVIDGIVNSESPDLSNTDISASEIQSLKNQIREGLDRGDQFRTDLKNEPRTESDYSHIKAVQEWMSGFKFAAASNITLEMYHRDHGGNHHHIGNLIQLDNQISVSLPFKALPEPEAGFTREFLLLKIHNGIVSSTTEFTFINVNQSEYSECVIQESQFSDFILAYRDVEEAKKPEPHITISFSRGGTADYETVKDDRGTKVILHAYPLNGYSFNKWEILYGNVEITDNAFYLGDVDVEIMAMFEPMDSLWNITFEVNGKGQLVIEPIKATPGQTVTVLALPDTGYELESLQASYSVGEISISKDEDDNYTFVMPDGNVKVLAVFDLLEKGNENPPEEKPVQEPNETQFQEPTQDDNQQEAKPEDKEKQEPAKTDNQSAELENKDNDGLSASTQTENKESSKHVPKTGDNAALGIWSLLVIAGLFGIVVSIIKERSR